MGLSMDTLTHSPGLETNGSARTEFLPSESPMVMSKQPLRGFQSREDDRAGALDSVAFRRACILIGTAAMTSAGCYEMYEVLQVGGVTTLEWMVLALFVLLFAWVAFSFTSAVAVFLVLLPPKPDSLGIDPTATLPTIRSRNAMLLPTYNEDPYRI